MAVKKDREYRDMTMEIRTAENEEAPEERKVVRGYASTFNEPYTLFETDDWRFNEVVDAERSTTRICRMSSCSTTMRAGYSQECPIIH